MMRLESADNPREESKDENFIIVLLLHDGFKWRG